MVPQRGSQSCHLDSIISPYFVQILFTLNKDGQLVLVVRQLVQLTKLFVSSALYLTKDLLCHHFYSTQTQLLCSGFIEKAHKLRVYVASKSLHCVCTEKHFTSTAIVSDTPWH